MPTILRDPIMVTNRSSCAFNPMCALNVEGCAQFDEAVYTTTLSIRASNVSVEAASTEAQATLQSGQMLTVSGKTGGVGFKWSGDPGTYYGLLALDDDSNRTYNRGFVGFEGRADGTGSGGIRDVVVSLPGSTGDTPPTERLRVASTGETFVQGQLRVQTYSETTAGLWVGTTQPFGMLTGPTTVKFESRDSDLSSFALNPMSHYASTHNFFTNTAASSGVYLTQASNSWQTHSDARKKANWTYFEGAAARVARLETVGSYMMVDPITKQPVLPGIRHVGLSAQEVQAILPEAVHEADDGYLSLAYQDVFVLGLQAVKEHEMELRTLRATVEYGAAENERLTLVNRKLSARVDALEAKLERVLRAVGEAL